jgi:DNA topoisomerase-2
MIRSIKAKHFMNSAFKEFSLYDNVRSIPSLLDGMKPSQRKALYGASLRGESASEIQVERLAASIAAETDYHHGTASMESTIVNMAANYTGTNNMNLFVPSGQFGSRLTKEAAASRYIFTQLSANYRKLFKKEDECILEHNIVDGQKIEPKNYMPILPLILVNGAQGTGTGYASYIMCYNPNDIKNSILNVLDKKTLAAFSLDP